MEGASAYVEDDLPYAYLHGTPLCFPVAMSARITPFTFVSVFTAFIRSTWHVSGGPDILAHASVHVPPGLLRAQLVSCGNVGADVGALVGANVISRHIMLPKPFPNTHSPLLAKQ
jgi:hypothetical protein